MPAAFSVGRYGQLRTAAPGLACAVLSPRSWLAAGFDPMPVWREVLAAYVRKHRDELRAAE